jgi:hypothetical protein
MSAMASSRRAIIALSRNATLARNSSSSRTCLRSKYKNGTIIVGDHHHHYLNGGGATTCSFHRNNNSPIILMFQNQRSFSTKSSTTTTILPADDPSNMSAAQLQQLIGKYTRQDNPTQATAILEHLELRNNMDTDSKQVDLSNIRTSVIDAWIKHQNSCIQDLKESSSILSTSSLLRVQEGYLEDICHAAERSSQIVETMKEKDKPTTHHYVAVLQAWANACEAAHQAGMTKSSDSVRGIPQRSQHILLHLMPQTMTNQTNTPITVECYNQVIKAWAYSGEYLRGTMAEQLFQKMVEEEPNGETFQLIIRAWSWSKERRCAFTATGHFMRMMKLLEFGRPDMEPSSMEFYHVLLRAWTTAE